MLKVLEDCEEEENLRIKAAGVILYHRVRQLARLMSRHHISLDPVGRKELRVKLFLPPPPCPPPNPSRMGLNRHEQRLETIYETAEEETSLYPTREGSKGLKCSDENWTTLYQYMPVEKRHAIYATDVV